MGIPEAKRLLEIAACVSEVELKHHLLKLIGPRNPFEARGALEKAADYIAGRLRPLGLDVSEDRFRAFGLFGLGRAFRNIVGTLRGVKRPEEVVLVVAHYDAVEGSPGADDNASGIASLLEVARALAPHRFCRTIQFVAFALEEWGYLGSRHFVNGVAGRRQRIVGVLDLEMVGFTGPEQAAPLGIQAPPRGDFVGVVGNKASAHLVETYAEAVKRFVPDLPLETMIVEGNGERLPLVRLSDHASFWDAGCPAIMITDTAFLRNPHYHEPTDTLDTLDLDFMRRVAAATAVAAAMLGEVL